MSRNDLPGTFTVNRLVLANQSSGILSIQGTQNSLRLAGVGPQIVMEGVGAVRVASPLVLDGAGGQVRITGAGQGGLTFVEAISEGLTSQALVIATTQASPGTQLVTLPNTTAFGPLLSAFTGGLVLESGTAVVTSNRSFGLGNIVFQGGTLRLVGVTQISTPIRLRSDAEIDLRTGSAQGGINVDFGLVGSESPGTGVTFRGANSANAITTATLDSAGYTGQTALALSRDAASITAESVAPTVVLTGASHLTGPIRVQSGGRLQIAEAAVSVGRIGDNTPIHLQGGILEFRATTGFGVQSETVGAIDGGGYSTISLSASSSPGTRLVAQSLARTDRETFLFRGAKLGTTIGAGVGNILINTPPTGLVGGGGSGANTSIVPWAIGDSISSAGAGTSFVTYDSTSGFRTLSTSEFATLTAAAPTNNVRQVSLVSGVNSDRTINSLLLDGGSIAGAGVLTITSGSVFQRSGAGVTNPISFGDSEANIFTVADLALTGALSGTGGLTKSSPGTLTLGGNNSFTGQLTVNAGTIAFPRIESLGTDDSGVVIGGNGAGLRYTGASPLDFTRPLATRDGFAVLSAHSADLSFARTISGAGGLSLSSGSKASIALASGNTFTGPTLITGGRVVIADDSALGEGGYLALASGTLALSGPWVTDREIYLGDATSGSLTTSGTLDTGSFDAVWNGVVRGILNKSGRGTLTLTQPALLERIDSLSGMLALAGEGSLPLGTIFVGNGGGLRLDNSSVVRNGRLLQGTQVHLQGSTFAIAGNASEPVTERLDQISIGAHGGNIVELTGAGTAGVTLQLQRGFSQTGGTTVLRAAQLGGAAGSAFERIVVDNPLGLGNGIVPGLLADPGLTGGGTHFVVYDRSTDAAGVIGFRPLAEAEFTVGSVLRNLENGGSTPTSAHFLAQGSLAVEGAINAVESLTLPAGGNVGLEAGQTIIVESGRVLVRGGTAPTSFTGGTLNFGKRGGELYAGGNVQISSALAGSGALVKSGPGTLTLSGHAGYLGGTLINEGTLSTGPGNPLATQWVNAAPGARLDVSSGSTTIGAVHVPRLNLGTSTLSVGSLGGDSSLAGITGSGQIVLHGADRTAAYLITGDNSGFNGTVRLDSGRLRFDSPDALGSGSLIVRGGSLGVESAFSFAPTITLADDLHIRGSSALGFGPGTTINGAHNVVVRSAGGLNVTGALTLEGQLRSEALQAHDFILTPGTIAIRGTSGNLSVPAGVHISTEGKLVLEYRADEAAPANSRLSDATPVTLRGGTLELASITDPLSPTPINSVESVGPITGAGRAVLTLHNNGASAQLIAESLTRAERGTILFSSSSGSFGSALGINAGQIKFATTPTLIGGGGTGADISVLPWAAGSPAVGGAGLVTLGLSGVRLLAANEYATSLASAAPTNNVFINGNGETLSDTRTVNSLTLGGALLGSGTLNITSGAVAVVTGASSPMPIQNNLNFGSGEAIFHVLKTGSGGITASGTISGTGGLTLSAGVGSTLTLGGNNTFSGPITINGGRLAFRSLDNLGGGLEPISLHGYSAGLSFSGAGSLAPGRSIQLRGGVSRLEASSASGVLDVADRISGSGGLRIAGSGTVQLGRVF